jgi:hypothetical protein
MGKCDQRVLVKFLFFKCLADQTMHIIAETQCFPEKKAESGPEKSY